VGGAVGVKVPRRRPRAVYEVYDADEALGGHQDFADAARPAEPEAAEDLAEQAAPCEDRTSYLDREHLSAAPALPIRGALTRMLAGATLCVAAVCVIAAIAIVMLHVVTGAGPARRGLASAPRVVHASHRSAQASASPVHVVTGPRAAAVANILRDGQPAPFPVARARTAISTVAALSIAPSGPRIQASTPVLQIREYTTRECECVPAEAEFGFER
jgi:hypothetical protein